MKVIFEKTVLDGENQYHYKQGDLCNCIKTLDSIVIGYEYDELTNDHCVGLFIENNETEYDRYDELYGINTLYKKVNYCPFCGEKIEVSIIDADDRTEEYKKLSNKLNELNNQFKDTDSISCRQELTKEIKRLCNLIDGCYGITVGIKDIEVSKK